MANGGAWSNRMTDLAWANERVECTAQVAAPTDDMGDGSPDTLAHTDDDGISGRVGCAVASSWTARVARPPCTQQCAVGHCSAWAPARAWRPPPPLHVEMHSRMPPGVTIRTSMHLLGGTRAHAAQQHVLQQHRLRVLDVSLERLRALEYAFANEHSIAHSRMNERAKYIYA